MGTTTTEGKVVRYARHAYKTEEIYTICEKSQVPVLFEGAARNWSALRWSPYYLLDHYPKARARVRIIPKVLPLLDRKPLVENECTFLEVTIGEFCNWLGDDQHKDAGKLTGISRDKFSIYMDYVYFGNLFKEYPNAVTEVNWREFNVQVEDAKATTFWFGSKGSSSNMHYDTYGQNFVVQVHGTKQWTLHPPGNQREMESTRFPYEESSVFSNCTTKNLTKLRTSTSASTIKMFQSDLLYVPHQWWHEVSCLETSVNVNLWINHPRDPLERVGEAITKLLVHAVKGGESKTLQVVSGGDQTESNDKNGNWMILGRQKLCSVTECMKDLNRSIAEVMEGKAKDITTNDFLDIVSTKLMTEIKSHCIARAREKHEESINNMATRETKVKETNSKPKTPRKRKEAPVVSTPVAQTPDPARINKDSVKEGETPSPKVKRMSQSQALSRPERPKNQPAASPTPSTSPLPPLLAGCPESLNVCCGELRGVLMIRSQTIIYDGQEIHPSDFETLGGRDSFKNWKQSIRICNEDGSVGVPLRKWYASHGLNKKSLKPLKGAIETKKQLKTKRKRKSSASTGGNHGEPDASLASVLCAIANGMSPGDQKKTIEKIVERDKPGDLFIHMYPDCPPWPCRFVAWPKKGEAEVDPSQKLIPPFLLTPENVEKYHCGLYLGSQFDFIQVSKEEMLPWAQFREVLAKFKDSGYEDFEELKQDSVCGSFFAKARKRAFDLEEYKSGVNEAFLYEEYLNGKRDKQWFFSEYGAKYNQINNSTLAEDLNSEEPTSELVEPIGGDSSDNDPVSMEPKDLPPKKKMRAQTMLGGAEGDSMNPLLRALNGGTVIRAVYGILMTPEAIEKGLTLDELRSKLNSMFSEEEITLAITKLREINGISNAFDDKRFRVSVDTLITSLKSCSD